MTVTINFPKEKKAAEGIEPISIQSALDPSDKGRWGRMVPSFGQAFITSYNERVNPILAVKYNPIIPNGMTGIWVVGKLKENENIEVTLRSGVLKLKSAKPKYFLELSIEHGGSDAQSMLLNPQKYEKRGRLVSFLRGEIDHEDINEFAAKSYGASVFNRAKNAEKLDVHVGLKDKRLESVANAFRDDIIKFMSQSSPSKMNSEEQVKVG